VPHHLRVEQQSPDQCRFAVIDAAAGQKAEQVLIGFVLQANDVRIGKVVVIDGGVAHQK
jgi:hypothetical protein